MYGRTPTHPADDWLSSCKMGNDYALNREFCCLRIIIICRKITSHRLGRASGHDDCFDHGRVQIGWDRDSLLALCSRLGSGVRITFRNLKKCGIGLGSRNLSDRHGACSFARIAVFDHQVDPEILRVPVFVGNNDLFAIVLVRDGLRLSNPVREHPRDLTHAEVFLVSEFVRRSIAVGGGKANRRWFGCRRMIHGHCPEGSLQDIDLGGDASLRIV
jgi:hypothetical protein